MTALTVADLTVDQFTGLVREAVFRALSDVLGDPDAGLELRANMMERIRQSVAAVDAGAPVVAAEEVAARLGLVW